MEVEPASITEFEEDKIKHQESDNITEKTDVTSELLKQKLIDLWP